MTINNPEVSVIYDLGTNKSNKMVLFSDYEALKNKLEKMQADYEEELSLIRQDRDSHFGMLVKSVKQVVVLLDECEQLRKDVKRYRWLRDGNNEKNSEAMRIAMHHYGDEWDEMIDAAMQEEKVRDQ